MKITKQFAILISVMFVLFLFARGVDAAFSCSSGSLDTTCYVTSTKTVTNGETVSGTGNLDIQSGGDITVATGSAFIIDMDGDVTVESGGKITGNLTKLEAASLTVSGNINVNGKGSLGGSDSAGAGTGGGGYYEDGSYRYGAGGGYGGEGGDSSHANALGGITYGSSTQPTDFGSGGGGDASCNGGNGGGAVKITISGTLTLNSGASITANGSDGVLGTTYCRSGGGSGGSIYITAGTLVGSGGSLTVNGGNASQTTGGAGGGGRIAIYYTTDNSTITKQAYGGGTTGYEKGGAGTIFTKAASATYGDLLVDNNSVSGAATTQSTDAAWAFDNLTIQNNAYYVLLASTSLNVSDTLTLNTTSTFEMRNFASSTSPTLTVYDMTISNGATMTHKTNGTTSATDVLNFTVTHDLTINSGGSVNVDYKGYPGSFLQAGYGLGGGGYYYSSTYYGGGAGYGGNGGRSSSASALGGVAYGSSTQPTDIGSSGAGASSASYSGGAGGGAVKITVTGTLTINSGGSISANGGAPPNTSTSQKPGAGSGGSIWISVGTLAGAGTITANGGNAADSVGGAGGGGRIAIDYTTDSSTITKQAYGGGTTGYQKGGAGTIFTKAASANHGDLLVDNNSVSGAYTPQLSGETWNFDNLTIQNSAYFTFASGDTLNVDDTFTLASSTFEMQNFASSTNPTLTVYDFVISGSSTLTHEANGTTSATDVLNFTVTHDLTINSGASINIDYKGYAGSFLTAGYGSGGGGYYYSSTYYGGGGGYGGAGGRASNANAAGGASYGSSTQPTDIGSSGAGASSVTYDGGAGGGAVKITVTGTLTINSGGSISANGEQPLASLSQKTGGGSGGSIYIITGTLAGAGTISANGGAGGDASGGRGGGGRIAIYYNTNNFAGTTTVNRGTSGYDAGADGTIYWEYFTTAVSATFSMNMWVKPASSIASKAIAVKNNEIRLASNESGYPFCQIYDGSDWQTAATSSIALPLSQWSYVSCTYDRSNIKIYLNGVLTATQTMSNIDVNDSANALNIGYDAGSTYGDLQGYVDEFKFYKYARSASQIKSDYVGLATPVGVSSRSAIIGEGGGERRVDDFTAYWPFDEMQGTTAYDKSINKNDLTLSSASWTTNGKFNGAYQGADNKRLTRVDDADFDFSATDSFSISVWFKRNTISNQEYLVYKQNGNEGYVLSLDASGDVIFGIGDVNSTSFPEESIGNIGHDYDDNNWHNAIAVKTSNSRIDLYVDGILIASDTSLTTDASLENSGKLIIGDTDEADGADEFLGIIDETKIYRLALSQADVREEFNKAASLKLGSLGGISLANSTSADSMLLVYCVPGDTASCSAPILHIKMDEASGQYANDVSGNGNNGTLGTGATVDASDPTWKYADYCKSGSCLSFDGVNDYVDTNNSSLWNLVNKFTISLWIKSNSTSQSNKYLLSKSNDFAVLYEYVNDNIEFYSATQAGTDPRPGSQIALADTSWHYIVYAYDGSTWAGYKDGAVVFSVSRTFSLNITDTYNLKINSARGGNGDGINGLIDDIRIYNYARTPAQIAWDYDRGAPIAWWKMDDGQDTATTCDATGSTVRDNSYACKNGGTCNNGTLYLSGSPATSTAWSEGKFNCGLDFDGTDDYVSITNMSRNDLMAVSFWVKPDTTTQKILELNATNSIEVSSGVITATGFGTETIYVDGRQTTAFSDTNWHHVVVVSDAAMAGNGLNLGKISTTYLAGSLDDARIYNYTLNSQQIKTLYNQDSAVRFGPTEGLP